MKLSNVRHVQNVTPKGPTGRKWLGGPVLRAVRESWDPWDPWASVMSALFPIAETLYRMDEHIPAEWEFRPAAALEVGSEPDEDEDHFTHELWDGVGNGWWDADDLRYAGTILSRYADWCRLVDGVSY